MKTISTPRDLLVEELKDLYSAENQLLKALPKMAEAASSDELREAFETHLEQAQGHVERLEKIGELLGESMTGKKCKAMAGLVAEGAEIIDEDAEPAMHDLALIGAAQKVEHYEIAGYGTTRTLAELAGETEVAEMLQATLDEEGDTDKLLTKIASEMDLDVADDDEDSDDKPAAKSAAKSVKSPASKTGKPSKSSDDDEAIPLKPETTMADDDESEPLVTGQEMGKKRARAQFDGIGAAWAKSLCRSDLRSARPLTPRPVHNLYEKKFSN
ncbi:MAG: ferritin-like domain-containing protein [Undibacterium sp.]|nr:ferritin-like domain-containing protein [Opitutaceae bacterium]